MAKAVKLNLAPLHAMATAAHRPSTIRAARIARKKVLDAAGKATAAKKVKGKAGRRGGSAVSDAVKDRAAEAEAAAVISAAMVAAGGRPVR